MSSSTDIKGLEFKVLDHGFVRVEDCMGDDSSVVRMARVSYANETKKLRGDRELLRYLMRNWHTSPFEGAQIKLHVKAPIMVFRQWHRHRTQSMNEQSARYSVLSDDMYVPDDSRWAKQSTTNKQGSGSAYSAEEASGLSEKLTKANSDSYKAYKSLLDDGVARELARGVLPVNIYSEMYTSINAHNLLHFLRLRLDNHAQYEIRAYGEVIAEIFKVWMPDTWQAFLDYRLNAINLTALDIDVIRELNTENGDPASLCRHFGWIDKGNGSLSREAGELEGKLHKIGMFDLWNDLVLNAVCGEEE